MRSYRNAGKGPKVRTDGEGNVHRGEGRNNFTYPGQTPGKMRKGVLTLHHEATRPRRTDKPSVEALEAMTRDELRALAKDRGLAGYGRLNKAGLVEVLA